MRAVYRRAIRRAIGGTLACALGAAAPACRGEPRERAATPQPPPARDSLDAFLDSYRLLPAPAPPGVEHRFATLVSPSGMRARALDPGARPLAAATPSRALAQLGLDALLVERAGMLRFEAGAAGGRTIGPPGSSTRVLGVGEEAIWLAVAGDGDRFWRVDRAGGVRDLGALPAGLEARVASPDGARLALLRAEPAGGDLLFLHERADGSTRLLLPFDAEGRFQPLAFSADGGRLLLIADDRSDLPRAEWLDLATGDRAPLSPPECAAVGASARGERDVAVALSCRGRAELLLLAGGERVELPAPADSRPVEAWPEGEAAWLYAVASARRPRDLWRTTGESAPRPLAHGLAPRIDPADLVAPEALELATAGGPVPAELWRPRGAERRAGIVWIDRDEGPALWFEFDPFLQFLAQRGVATLRLRLPGADGFGRAFRARGEGATAGERRALLDAAARELERRAELPPGRLALVALGPRPGATALEAAAAGHPWIAVAAIDPAEAALAAGAPRAPLLLVSAPPPAAEAPGEASGGAAVPAAELAGATRLELAPPAPPAPRLEPALAAALWRHLQASLASRATVTPAAPGTR